MIPSGKITLFLALVSAPLFEFLLLRFLVHSVFGLRIGYPGMTDYDFVPAAILVFFVFLASLAETKPLHLGWNKRGFLVHLGLLVSFTTLCAFYSSLSVLFGGSFFAFWVVSAIAAIFSGLFIWVKPAYFLFHPDRLLAIPALFATASKLLSRHLFDALWLPTARVTGQSAYAVLSVLTPGVSLHSDQVYGGQVWQVLDHPLHLVSIGVGCSGLEGIFFFLFIGTLIVMAQWRNFGLSRGLLFIFVGTTAMYWVNVFRIILIDVGGMGMVLLLGPQNASFWIAGSIHVFLSWVLYTAFLFAYLYVWKLLVLDAPSDVKSPEGATPWFSNPDRMAR